MRIMKMEMEQKSSPCEQTNNQGLVLYYWHYRICKKSEKEINQSSVLQML